MLSVDCSYLPSPVIDLKSMVVVVVVVEEEVGHTRDMDSME